LRPGEPNNGLWLSIGVYLWRSTKFVSSDSSLHIHRNKLQISFGRNRFLGSGEVNAGRVEWIQADITGPLQLDRQCGMVLLGYFCVNELSRGLETVFDNSASHVSVGGHTTWTLCQKVTTNRPV
jgi:hypothetical protein